MQLIDTQLIGIFVKSSFRQNQYFGKVHLLPNRLKISKTTIENKKIKK